MSGARDVGTPSRDTRVQNPDDMRVGSLSIYQGVFGFSFSLEEFQKDGCSLSGDGKTGPQGLEMADATTTLRNSPLATWEREGCKQANHELDSGSEGPFPRSAFQPGASHQPPP